MKKSLLLALCLPLALGISCAPTAVLPFQSFLTPGNFSVDKVRFGKSDAIVFANGTDRTIRAVSLGITGVSNPDAVTGALVCEQIPTGLFCKVATEIRPNDGLTVFVNETADAYKAGYLDGNVVITRSLK